MATDFTLNGAATASSTARMIRWGWHPGMGRKPAPGTQAEFGTLMQAWVDSGAKCPA